MKQIEDPRVTNMGCEDIYTDEELDQMEDDFYDEADYRHDQQRDDRDTGDEA